jgi:hypothetical protein
MTHDELLARLDGQIAGSKAIGCECPACDNAVALRAVVELHQSNVLPFDKYLEPFCIPCDTNYPCETIQVIEKELK